MEGYYERLQLQYEEEVEKLKQLKLELEEISSQIADFQSQHYNLRLENDEILSLQDRQVKLQNYLSEQIAATLTNITGGFENFDDKIHDVFTDYDVEKETERAMVLQTFQTFKDIPNAYSSEVIKEKMKGIELQIEDISEMIDLECAEFIELKDKFKAEDTTVRDATLDTFITELKKIIIQHSLMLPKH